eukprot:TRINITY_DN508_c0_g2_i5.p1 TRINITY_DN508_c0_g2~~TRINITY_DN508_c0_g2_i5.p1  ORF type:complete len:717 (-),score=109.61 TRINITY_DN508_c0_g2_i5:7-2157(-)
MDGSLIRSRSLRLGSTMCFSSTKRVGSVLSCRVCCSPSACSGAVGRDMAAIQSVHVDGTAFSALACTDCPDGMHSARAASTCNACSLDQVGGVDGSCQDCAADEYALFGSLSCTPRPECDTHDYIAHTTDCVNASKTTYHEWLQPKVCGGTAVQLPGNSTTACLASCGPGMMYDSGLAECEPCLQGQFSASVGAVCEPCPVGAVPYPVLDMSSFTTFPASPSFTVTPLLCRGVECLEGQGFRLIGNIMDSGTQTGTGLYSTLRITITVSNPDGGKLVVYSRPNSLWDCHNNSVQIQLEGDLPRDSSCDGSQTVPLHVGSNVVTLTAGDQSNPQALLFIERMVLQGTANGGGIRCDQCPAGKTPNLFTASCDACPEGTFSDASTSHTCTACPVGSVTGLPGSAQCHACPSGFKTDGPGSTHCVCDTLVSRVGTHDFNLTRLERLLARQNTKFDILNTSFPGVLQFSVCGPDGPSASIQVTTARNDQLVTDTIKVGHDLATTEQSDGLAMGFANGDLATAQSIYPCLASGGARYKTALRAQCGSVNSGAVADHATYDKGSCTFNLWVVSSSACPLCIQDMMEKSVSKCTDGEQTSEWKAKDGVDCVVSTTNALFGEVITNSCSTTEVTNTALILGITIPLIVVTILAGFAVKKWLAYRTLYNQYSNLKANVPADHDEFGATHGALELDMPQHSEMDEVYNADEDTEAASQKKDTGVTL